MRFFKNLFLFLTICTSAIITTSCSYKPQQVLFEAKTGNPTAPVSNMAANAPAYHIQPQDILQVRNLQNRKYIVDESTTAVSNNTSMATAGQTYQVEEDGTVTLPVIGHVSVAGLTRAEAAKRVEDLYRKELRDPIIELKIVNLKVTILGEIKAQGNYPLTKDKTTLVEVIGEAGGLTERANAKNIKIVRGGAQNQQSFELDLSDVNTLQDPRILLQNNDIIYITQNKQAVRSDKLQNFSSILSPAVVLLNTALIIYTLTR